MKKAHKIGLASLLLSIFVSMFIHGCSDKQQTKEKHLTEAKQYLEQKNFDKARIELKNVLQIDPKMAEAYNLLGQVEENRQAWKSAINHYARAIELDPSLLSAQTRLGQFYLLQAENFKLKNNSEAEKQAIQKVQKQINTILSLNPDYIDGLMLKATLLVHQGKTETAIKELKAILKNFADKGTAIRLLSKIYAINNNIDQAIKVLKTGIHHSPDNIKLRRYLAETYIRNKQTEQAILLMHEIIEQNPESLEYRILLAGHYEKLNQADKAEITLRNAISADPDDVSRYLILAHFLNKWKGANEAISELKSAIKHLPDEPKLWFGQVSIYINNKETDQAIIILEEIIKKWPIEPAGIMARKELAKIYEFENNVEKIIPLYKAILEENPNDNDAIILKAKVAFSKKDYETAITSFRTALKNQPDSITTLHLLAESHLRNGDIYLARELFIKATNIAVDNPVTYIQLSRFNFITKESDQALEQIDIALKLDSNHLAALILKSEILAEKGDIDNTIPVLKKIKEVAPGSPDGWFRMGRLLKTQKKFKLAHKEFISAWKRLPDSLSLLAELIDIEISIKEFKTAEKRLHALLEKNPEHPAAHKFLGMLYLAEKKYGNSEKEFKKHLKIFPDDFNIYIQLASMHNLLGNLDQSSSYYKKGMEISPNNFQLKFGLAGVYELQNNYDGAINLYEEILNAQPDNAVATNNLAIVLANNKTDKNSLGRAKQLVEMFKESNQPVYMDTYGWVYYKLGQYEQALAPLEQAVAMTKNISIFQYHLGMVYFQLGDKKNAKIFLSQAINTGKFPGKDDAIATLRLIK